VVEAEVQVLKVHLTLQHLQADLQVVALDQIQRNLTQLMLVDGWMLVLVAGITIMAGAAGAVAAVATNGGSQNHGLIPGGGSKNHPPRYHPGISAMAAVAITAAAVAITAAAVAITAAAVVAAAVATSGISTMEIHRSEAAASFTTSTFALIIIRRSEENF